MAHTDSEIDETLIAPPPGSGVPASKEQTASAWPPAVATGVPARRPMRIEAWP